MTKIRENLMKRMMVFVGMFMMALLLCTVPQIKVNAAAPQTKCAAVPRKTSTKACVSLKVSWRKANGADGYVIYRSTSRFTGFRQIKDVRSKGALVYNDSSVSEAKVYYYRVRAYKNCNGRRVYGNFTSISINKVMKSIKVKKTSFWASVFNYFS